MCPCHVPLTVLSPIPTTPALERGRQQRQNSCRSSWVRCQSVLHSFCWPYSAFPCCLLQSPSPPPAHSSSSQLHSFWPLAPAALLLLSWRGQPLLFHSLLSLPAACPAYFGHELPVTQRATQSLAHWGPFPGTAVITTAESHCAYIFTSLYRNIQWCFTRL